MKRTDDLINDSSRDNKITILRYLFGRKLRKATEDKIRAWLSDEEDAVAKNDALERIFEQEYKDPVRTDIHTLNTLNELHCKIGLPEVDYVIVNSEVLIPVFWKHTIRRAPSRRRAWLRVAAVLVPVLIATGIGLLLMERADTMPTIFTTVRVPAGETRNVTLPDGSEVRIAPETEMMYADNFIENRSVKLSGEAFFIVKRAEGSPFTVETENLRTTVLGTEFNVQARAGRPTTEVSLASGSVEVWTDKCTVVLAPMERLVLDNASGMSTVNQIDRTEVGVWKGTMLVLDNLLVEEALGKVAEFYGVGITMQDGFHSDKHVRTVLHREDSLDDVMRMLQAIDPDLAYSIEGDTVEVSNR